MSLTISAAQVASFIANPSSFTGYSSGSHVIISGAISHTQATALDAVSATYIQATVSETTIANLSAISASNTTRSSLNKYSFVVSDTSATAAELTAVQALTSVAVDASNITSIESSSASDITTLIALTTAPTGISADPVTVSDTTVSATTLNTIDTFFSSTVTATAATTITGPLADIETAMSSGGITDSASVAVTVTDTSVAAASLNTVNGLTTGVVTCSNATTVTGTVTTVQTAMTANNAGTIAGIGAANVTLDDPDTTGTQSYAVADIHALIDTAGFTGKVTATVTEVTADALTNATTGVTGTGHSLTITMTDASATATELTTISAATILPVTLDPAGDAITSVESSTYATALALFQEGTAGFTGLSASAVIVSDSITVAQANALDALTTGVITATISDQALSVLGGLTGTGNAYTTVVQDTTVAASDINALIAKTTVAVDDSAATTVTGNLTDLNAFYVTNAAGHSGEANEAVTVSDTTLDAALLTAVNGLTTGVITVDATSITGQGDQIVALYDADAAAGHLTGLDGAETLTITGDSGSTTVIQADDLVALNADTSGLITIDSTATAITGTYANIEACLTQNKLAAGVVTVDNESAADASRTAGTYTIGASDYTATGSGTGATFTATVASNGAVTIAVNAAGTSYAVDNTFTIADAKLGGGGGAAFTFDVASVDTTGVATPTISGLDNLAVTLSDATVTLTEYTDIQNNYTTGVITATLANDAIADVINETVTGTNDLVSGNAFSVTLTDGTIAAADLIELYGMTSGKVTVSGITLTGTVEDIATVYSYAGTTGNVIAGLGDGAMTPTNTGSVSAADLKAISAGTTGTLNITNVTRITGLLADVNSVLADGQISNKTKLVTLTDATISATDLATLLADGAQLTDKSVTVVASSIEGDAAAVATIMTATTGLLNQHNVDNGNDGSTVVIGMDGIDVTITGTATAAQIGAISTQTTGTVTATILGTQTMTNLLATGALSEAISSSFAGHDLTITLADTEVTAANLITLATLTKGTISLDTDTTTTGAQSPAISGSYADLNTVFSESKISGYEASAITVTGGATVAQINTLGGYTTGVITATVSDGDMATLAGITETTNALSIAVTDASISATALDALDAKTTGLVNVAATSTLTGTLAEVTATLARTTTVSGVGAMLVSVSDTSITVAEANALDALTTGAITATITETDLDTLITLGTGNAWVTTVDKQTADNPATTGTDETVTTINAGNLATLDGLTSNAVTVTAPSITGTYAQLTASIAANTAGTVTGLDSKAITISDATITQAEAETAQAWSTGVVTATIGKNDFLTAGTVTQGTVNLISAITDVSNGGIAANEVGTYVVKHSGAAATLFQSNGTTAITGASYAASTGAATAGGSGATFTIKIAANGATAIDQDGYTATTAGSAADTTRTDGTYYISESTTGIAVAATNGEGVEGAANTTANGYRLKVVVTNGVAVTTLLAGGAGFADNDVIIIPNEILGGDAAAGAVKDLRVVVAGLNAKGMEVEITDAGSGYTVGDTFTISAAYLDTAGTAGTNDLVFKVGELSASRTAGTTSVTSYTTSGGGTGATFSVVVDGDGDATVTGSGGTGFEVGDTVTITDATLGGGGAAALTFAVGTVGKDSIADFIAQTTAGTYDIESGNAFAITFEDTSIAAADLIVANSLTDGLITLTAAGGGETTLTGSTADLVSAYAAAVTTGNGILTSSYAASPLTLSEPATFGGLLDAASIKTLDEATTGLLTVTRGTTITGISGSYADVHYVFTQDSTDATHGVTTATITGIEHANMTVTLTGSSTVAQVNDIVGNYTSGVVTATISEGDMTTLATLTTTAGAYTVNITDTTVAAAALNTLDGDTTATITLATGTTLTGALANNGAVDTALSSSGITGIGAVAVTSDDATNTVTEANDISSQTTGVVTATLATGALSTFAALNETGNAFTINVSDTGTVDAATVNVLNGKTTGTVSLVATGVSGSLSDIKTLYEANTASEVTGLGNETVTISDTGSVSAADLNTVNGLTTGVITATGVTTVTGTLAEIKTAYAAGSAGTISGLGNEAITVTDSGVITSTDLSDLDALTTGAVTVSLSGSSIAAATLNTLDADSTTVVSASSVTTLTGSAADVNTAYASSGLSGLGDEAVTLTDTSLTASTLNTLNGNTTGTIDASTVTTITGSVADANTMYATAGISGGGDEAVTITDTTIVASALNTLDGNTTGAIDASSLTTITGTGADAQTAFESTGISGLTFDASSYLASYSDLLAAFGTDLTLSRTHYFAFGVAEGRSFDSFDEASYLASYTDLLAAFGTNTDEALVHYINHGYSEGRAVDTFDENSYLASNSSLIGTVTDAAAHYVSTGYAAGLALDTFDELSYIASYSDLISAFGSDGALGTKHFVEFGSAEGRTDTFDELGYIASHSDLIAAYGTDTTSAALHYISYGSTEGRTVSFDASSYLAAHADLRAAFGTDQELAKKHYIEFGSAEGRALT